jgi:hydrogenase maturation protease
VHFLFDAYGGPKNSGVARLAANWSPPDSSTSTTLVLALGNPLRGDDGVGPEVLDRLKQVDLPRHVVLVDGGTGGLEVVLEFVGKSRGIVIDAVRFGGEAGQYRRFDLLDMQLPPAIWTAGHAHGLVAAIELGRALQILPKELILYAIEPEQCDRALHLSQAAKSAISEVANAIVAELHATPAVVKTPKTT